MLACNFQRGGTELRRVLSRFSVLKHLVPFSCVAVSHCLGPRAGDPHLFLNSYCTARCEAVVNACVMLSTGVSSA